MKYSDSLISKFSTTVYSTATDITKFTKTDAKSKSDNDFNIKTNEKSINKLNIQTYKRTAYS